MRSSCIFADGTPSWDGPHLVKRLLLVTYYYPPLAGSGVFRPLRLSKTLPEHGWDVTVLTVGATARVLKDPMLCREVPASVRVERTASVEPRVPLLALRRLGLAGLAARVEPWFYLPDDQRGWVPFAARRGAQVLRETKHDAVLSTSGPYSAHLVALRLHRRFGLPWVADFRDEWTTNPYIRYPTTWHQRLNERLERQVLREADRVVCVSKPWLSNLAALVPEEPESKFVELANGYDRDHHTDPGPLPDRFRVVYAGAFYGPRSPAIFLQALENVVAAGGIPREDLDVVFVGHTSSDHGLDRWSHCNLRVIPQQPFAAAIEHLRQGAVLLLVIPPEGGPGNHTGKLFNYLATGRPILALAPEPNVAAELIRDSRSGVVAASDDPRDVARALISLYADWKAGRSLPDQDRGLIGTYEARYQVGAWSRLLDGLAGADGRRPPAPLRLSPGARR